MEEIELNSLIKSLQQEGIFVEPMYVSNINETYIVNGTLVENVYLSLNCAYKNNVLLVGNSGVGKTALSYFIAKKFYLERVYMLNVNIVSLLASTKYRGDF